MTMERTSNTEEGIQKYSNEEKKRERKQKIDKITMSVKKAIPKVIGGIAICAMVLGLLYFLVWMYYDSHREAVAIEHQCIVNGSEMIYIPSYIEDGNEYPAKMVNYVDAKSIEDSTTYKWNPLYLDELVQVGDTITVYTYHSAKMNLESKKIRYRWDGELYE